MKKLSLIILALFILQGCTTTTKVVGVTTQPEKTITLSYSTGSFDDLALRADAKRKADDFCQKPATLIAANLINEGPSAAWGVLSKDEAMHLTFNCK